MTVDYAARLAAVRSRIDDAARLASRSGEEIKLIAVSKYASIDQVVAAYAAGQRDFGENYLQDAIAKIEAVIERLGADAIEHDPPRWHMIGQLQSNKAARVATPALQPGGGADVSRAGLVLPTQDGAEPGQRASLLQARMGHQHDGGAGGGHAGGFRRVDRTDDG
jgi:hypothetical protein